MRERVPCQDLTLRTTPPPAPANFPVRWFAHSAGNRAYSFFEDQIVPHREALRLHKIKVNPLTGNFHSR